MNLKKMKIWGIRLILLLVFFGLGFDVVSAAEPLVPCGRRGQDPCRLCDLIVGISGIIKWIRNVMVAISLGVITWGGIVYMVSAGNEQMMEKAKGMIKTSLIGVALVLASWMIINSLFIVISINKDFGVGVKDGWSTFVCE